MSGAVAVAAAAVVATVAGARGSGRSGVVSPGWPDGCTALSLPPAHLED